MQFLTEYMFEEAQKWKLLKEVIWDKESFSTEEGVRDAGEWKAGHVLAASSIKRKLASRRKEGIASICSVLMSPHLKYYIQFWGPQHNRVAELLEWIRKRATKLIKGLEHHSYEERLQKLGLFSLKRRRLQGDLIEAFQEFTGKRGTDFLHG